MLIKDFLYRKNPKYLSLKKDLQGIESAINTSKATLAQAKHDLGTTTVDEVEFMLQCGTITQEQADNFVNAIHTLQIIIENQPGVIQGLEKQREDTIKQIKSF